MANDRIDAALTIIEAIAGGDDRRTVQAGLRGKNEKQIDESLSIGGFRGPFKSEPETFRRSLARAVLLVQLAGGKTQAAQAAMQLKALMARPTAALQRELLAQFPYKPYRGNFSNRQHWLPVNFTEPSRHSTGSYRYVVHSLMQAPSKVAEYNLNNDSELENFNKLRERYLPYASVSRKNPVKPNLMVDFMAQYLADPGILRQNIISCSLISDAKHATYYPLGFILRVPPECIYVTSAKDVGVANRTGDILGELKRVHGPTAMTIQTPDEVLAATTGKGGATGYNEIVVVGTAPEGKQVEVAGLFVKTDPRGNLYVSSNLTTKVADTSAWLTPKAVALISDCAKKFNLPIVRIPDATSAAVKTPTPWPFGDAQGVVAAKVQPGHKLPGLPGMPPRGRAGTL